MIDIYRSLLNIYSYLFKFSGIAENIQNMRKYREFDISFIRMILGRSRGLLYNRYSDDNIGVNNSIMDKSQFSSKYGRIIQWSVQNILDIIPNNISKENINVYDIYINEVIDPVAKYLQIENFILKNEPGFNYLQLDFKTFNKKVDSMSSLFEKNNDAPSEEEKFEDGKVISTFTIEPDDENYIRRYKDSHRGITTDTLYGEYTVTQISNPNTLRNMSENTGWCTKSFGQATSYIDANSCLYLFHGSRGDDYLYSPTSAIFNDLNDDDIPAENQKIFIEKLVDDLLSKENPPINTVLNIITTNPNAKEAFRKGYFPNADPTIRQAITTNLDIQRFCDNIASYVYRHYHSTYFYDNEIDSYIYNIEHFINYMKDFQSNSSTKRLSLNLLNINLETDYDSEKKPFQKLLDAIDAKMFDFLQNLGTLVSVGKMDTERAEKIENYSNKLIDFINEIVLNILNSNSPNTVCNGLKILTNFNILKSKTPNELNEKLGSPINYDLNNFVFRKISQLPKSINDFFNLLPRDEITGYYTECITPLLNKLGSSSKKIFLKTLSDILGRNLKYGAKSIIDEKIIIEKIVKNISPYASLIASIEKNKDFEIDGSLIDLVVEQSFNYMQESKEQRDSFLNSLTKEIDLTHLFNIFIRPIERNENIINSNSLGGQIKEFLNDYNNSKESSGNTELNDGDKIKICNTLLKRKNYFGEDGIEIENLINNIKHFINIRYYLGFIPEKEVKSFIDIDRNDGINFISRIAKNQIKKISSLTNAQTYSQSKDTINYLLNLVTESPEASFKFFELFRKDLADGERMNQAVFNFIINNDRTDIIQSAFNFDKFSKYLEDMGKSDTDNEFVDQDSIQLSFLNLLQSYNIGVNSIDGYFEKIKSLIESYGEINDNFIYENLGNMMQEDDDDNEFFSEKLDLARSNSEEIIRIFESSLCEINPKSKYYKENIKEIREIFEGDYGGRNGYVRNGDLVPSFRILMNTPRLVKDIVLKDDFIANVNKKFIDIRSTKNLLDSLKKIMIDEDFEEERITDEELQTLINSSDADFDFSLFMENFYFEINKFKRDLLKSIQINKNSKDLNEMTVQLIENFFNSQNFVFNKKIFDTISESEFLRSHRDKINQSINSLEGILYDAQSGIEELTQSYVNEQEAAYNTINNFLTNTINKIESRMGYSPDDLCNKFLLSNGRSWNDIAFNIIGNVSDWIDLENLIFKNDINFNNYYLEKIRNRINETESVYVNFVSKISESNTNPVPPTYPVLNTLFNIRYFIDKELNNNLIIPTSIFKIYKLFKK